MLPAISPATGFSSIRPSFGGRDAARSSCFANRTATNSRSSVSRHAPETVSRSRPAISSLPTTRRGFSAMPTRPSPATPASASRSTRAAMDPCRSSSSSVGPGSGTRRFAGSVESADSGQQRDRARTRPPAGGRTYAVSGDPRRHAILGKGRLGFLGRRPSSREAHDPVETDLGVRRHARRRAADPASRISSSRTYSEKRSDAGSRPSASHRARTAAIRSATSFGDRNT